MSSACQPNPFCSDVQRELISHIMIILLWYCLQQTQLIPHVYWLHLIWLSLKCGQIADRKCGHENKNVDFCAHSRAYPRRSLSLTAAHCRSLPLTVAHCRSLPLTVAHCRSLPLTAAHCRSLPLVLMHEYLRGNDKSQCGHKNKGCQFLHLKSRCIPEKYEYLTPMRTISKIDLIDIICESCIRSLIVKILNLLKYAFVYLSLRMQGWIQEFFGWRSSHQLVAVRGPTCICWLHNCLLTV